MFAQLPLTEMLASFIGLYFAAAGAGLIFSPTAYSSLMNEMLEKPVLVYTGGILAFLIGATILGLHDRWDDLLSSFVSFIGWAALAEGVMLLAVPRQFIGLFAKITLTQTIIRGVGIATAALGLLLLAAVFI